ncbi:hypothetical protein GLOIN_2v1708780 [Rhizophagus clarus]|uniref:Uncharacterized protein n=2 Tax=Rhizophagus clarus TaxID=94130 RepID=A0A8H3QWJ2_9GLOM|nr:hypothetical protein GLOIN_2v1708780 [Rhizophagus clarus]
MSVNESNAFEFEVLKQRITELEAENSRVLAEKAELLKQIAEERAKYEAENAELKGRIEELEKSRADADAKNARHDVVNAKLKDRVAKLEQDYGQVQSDSMPLVSSFTRSEPVVIPDCETKDAVPKVQFSTNNLISANSKTSEDREMDALHQRTGKWMLSWMVHKKSVSDGIKQRNKEKKLQNDLIAQDSVIPDSRNDRLIAKNLESLEKTVTNLLRSDYVHINTSEVSGLVQNDEVDVVDTSQIIEQGLIYELIQNQCEISYQNDSTSLNDKINKSCIQDMENLIPDSAKSLSHLFDKAVKKGQEEILCWYYYSLEFENRVKSLIADGTIKDKTARTKIYKEMKPFLPCITDTNLRKKTQRARKILKLFGEEGVGIAKIKQIKVNTLAKSLTSGPNASETQARKQGLDSAKVSTLANVLSAPQSNTTYDRAYFRNKTLDQYLLYIGNLVVKILTITELLMRDYVHYAN